MHAQSVRGLRNRHRTPASHDRMSRPLRRIGGRAEQAPMHPPLPHVEGCREGEGTGGLRGLAIHPRDPRRGPALVSRLRTRAQARPAQERPVLRGQVRRGSAAGEGRRTKPVTTPPVGHGADRGRWLTDRIALGVVSLGGQRTLVGHGSPSAPANATWASVLAGTLIVRLLPAAAPHHPAVAAGSRTPPSRRDGVAPARTPLPERIVAGVAAARPTGRRP